MAPARRPTPTTSSTSSQTTKDGDGDTTAYEYDLANEQTQITYPNGQTVEHTYDNAGRLHSVTDWLGHATTFAYDPDSDLTAIVFPSATEEEDTYNYNDSRPDQQDRDDEGRGLARLRLLHPRPRRTGRQAPRKGLPGPNQTATPTTKTTGSRTRAPPAMNTTPRATRRRSGEASLSYNEANELETGLGASYTYSEHGERTKTTPTSGPATTYGYDQAEDLTSISRPEEDTTPKIEDTYAYNGDGLRQAKRSTRPPSTSLGTKPADYHCCSTTPPTTTSTGPTASRSSKSTVVVRSLPPPRPARLNSSSDRLHGHCNWQMHLQPIRHPDV